MSKAITFVAALVLGVAGGFGLAQVGSQPVVTGLQPKYEAGLILEVPCPEHGLEEFTVVRPLVSYELSNPESPFPVFVTEDQIDELLATVK